MSSFEPSSTNPSHGGGGGGWNVDVIGALVLLTMTAATYVLGVGPLISRHESVRQQHVELAQAHAKARQASAELVSVQQELAAAEQKVTATPLRLQPASQLNQRLALVTDLATRSGTRLDDLQPGKVTEGARYGVLPIRVAGTGSYPTFAALLNRLRNECPDLGINGFDVSGTPAEGPAAAKFGFDLIWYTQPQAKASAAATAAPPAAGKGGAP